MKENQPTTDMEFPEYKHFVYICPCLLVIVSYMNALSGQFVHDDVFAIQHNSDVTGGAPISHLFRNDFWGTPMDDINSHKSYRPLCILSFRLDYAISGGNPVWFHVVNFALHLCVTLALTRVCLCVLRTSEVCAALTGSLFAVHPIHTEAVTGLVGRAEILAALFFLLSLQVFSRTVLPTRPGLSKVVKDKTTQDTWDIISTQLVGVAVTVLLAAAAMLCKETGLTVLGVCAVFDLLIHGKDLVRNWRQRQLSVNVSCCLVRCLSLTIGATTLISHTGILYYLRQAATLMVFRLWMMNFQQPQVFQEETNPASYSPVFLTRLLTFTFLPTFNLWLLLCPITLSYDWTGASIPLVDSPRDSRNIYSLLVYSALMVMAVRCLRQQFAQVQARRHTTSTHTATLMSLALLTIPFLPASNLFFRVGFVVAERVLYIPSMGFCLLVAQGFLALCARLPRFKPQLVVACGLLVVVLAARTWSRNPVWQSRRALFLSGIQSLPNNAKIHYNLANMLKDEGNMREAQQHYRHAIRLNPNVASYHLNLGTILTNKTEARQCYQEALRLRPQHTGALVNLGSLFVEAGDSSGMAYIRQALDIEPNHIEALLVMSSSFLRGQDAQEAHRYIQRALHIKPDSAKVRLCHAIYLHHTDQTSAALQEYRITLRLNPNDTDALLNSARLHFSTGQLMEAERQLDRAVGLTADCSQCFSLLGSIYSSRGHIQDAVKALGRAAALEPNNVKINLKYIQMLKNNNQGDQAWTVLQQVLARQPSSLEGLKFAFAYAMQEHKYSQALPYIQNAISLAEEMREPTVHTLYRDLGEAFRHNHDHVEALRSYEKAVELNSTFVEAITDAGTVHFLQKNYAQAESYYLQALSIDPGNSLATQNLQKLRNVYTKSVNVGRL